MILSRPRRWAAPSCNRGGLPAPRRVGRPRPTRPAAPARAATTAAHQLNVIRVRCRSTGLGLPRPGLRGDLRTVPPLSSSTPTNRPMAGLRHHLRIPRWRRSGRTHQESTSSPSCATSVVVHPELIGMTDGNNADLPGSYLPNIPPPRRRCSSNCRITKPRRHFPQHLDPFLHSAKILEQRFKLRQYQLARNRAEIRVHS